MKVDAGYYPSVVVNLKLRFDEALQVAQDPAGFAQAVRSGELGLRPEEIDEGRAVTVRVGDITAESYDQSGGTVTRRVMPGRRTSTSAGPRVRVGRPFAGLADEDEPRVRIGQPYIGLPDDAGAADGELAPLAVPRRGVMPLTFGGDGFTVIMNAVPQSGSFELPHPRQAPKFTIRMKYDDVPVDPRLLRAAGVEIHLGCVAPDDFGRGQLGGQAKDGRSSSILPTRMELLDPSTGRPAVADNTLLFYGTVDEWTVEHTNEGSTATLIGRGIVAILLDGKPGADVLKRIDLTRPIHRVVADLIATIPVDSRLALDVMTDAEEWPGGVIPSPGSIEGFTNIRLGAADGQPKAGGGGGDKISYWDLITNLCNFVGGVPYLQGSTLWIRPGHSIFEMLDNPGRAPFRTPRYAPDGQLSIRRLVLGHNVEGFKLSRKFGGVTVPIVRVYGFDDRVTGKDRVVVGQWPPKDSPAAQSKTDDEMIHVPMGGIRDPDRLTQIARSLYEEQGRGEVGGDFRTACLSSFGGDNSDPDLLRLRPLDPVEILVDNSTGPSPVVNELSARLSMSFDEEVTKLAGRLGDRDAARAIVAARRGVIVGILDAYRVTSVRYDIDASSGVRISAEFQNYIVARHAATATAQSTAGAARVKTVSVTNPGQNRRPGITKRKLAKVASMAALDVAATLGYDARPFANPDVQGDWLRYREQLRLERIRLARGQTAPVEFVGRGQETQ